jgi:DNA-binding NarL/FixJ family response regulator
MPILIEALAVGQDDVGGQPALGQGEFWRPGSAPEEPDRAERAVPKIALVDDDEDLLVYLTELGAAGHFSVAGTFRSGAEALDHLSKNRVDAVIMDIRLPDMSGIDCARKLRTILPSLPIVILTGYPDSQSLLRSLLEGANGFLVKPVTAQEFLDAIADVLNGGFALARQAVPLLLPVLHRLRDMTRGKGLTAREEEILACLFRGMPDKEIAGALGIGTATVHTHMHRLFEKLGVHSRREIIAKYLDLR